VPSVLVVRSPIALVFFFSAVPFQCYRTGGHSWEKNTTKGIGKHTTKTEGTLVSPKCKGSRYYNFLPFLYQFDQKFSGSSVYTFPTSNMQYIYIYIYIHKSRRFPYGTQNNLRLVVSSKILHLALKHITSRRKRKNNINSIHCFVYTVPNYKTF
jgi:hypothetical protein